MGAPISAAIDLLVALLGNATLISNLIQTAQAAGQKNLSPEQWAQITGADDSAETQLAAAIASAKAAGR